MDRKRWGFVWLACLGLASLFAIIWKVSSNGGHHVWSYQGCQERWCQVFTPYPLGSLQTKVDIRGATIIGGWQYIVDDRVLENVVWEGSNELTREQLEKMLGGFLYKMRDDTGKSIKVIGYEADGTTGRLAFKTLGGDKNTAASITIIKNGSKCASLWLAWNVSDEQFTRDAYRMQEAFLENLRVKETR